MEGKGDNVIQSYLSCFIIIESRKVDTEMEKYPWKIVLFDRALNFLALGAPMSYNSHNQDLVNGKTRPYSHWRVDLVSLGCESYTYSYWISFLVKYFPSMSYLTTGRYKRRVQLSPLVKDLL